MRTPENLRKVKQKSSLPGGARRREAWGTHLPNGRQRVLGRVVAAAAVGDDGNAVPGLEHLQGSAGGHRLKAEQAQQEVEAAGEEAGIEGTTRYQQEQQEQEGEGAQEAPLFLPQPHAGARTGTDGSPGPAGLPGQERDAREEAQGSSRRENPLWGPAPHNGGSSRIRRGSQLSSQSSCGICRARGRSRCHGNGVGLRR